MNKGVSFEEVWKLEKWDLDNNAETKKISEERRGTDKLIEALVKLQKGLILKSREKVRDDIMKINENYRAQYRSLPMDVQSPAQKRMEYTWQVQTIVEELQRCIKGEPMIVFQGKNFDDYKEIVS